MLVLIPTGIALLAIAGVMKVQKRLNTITNCLMNFIVATP
ncbi:hypothetical protein VCR3J2_320386 [Vibrio coralliirubri]|nr:hypothetical protein VCR3J2_320386 [Vibrio coralliirubri]